MDAFLQHLASRKTQLSVLYKSDRCLEDWLRLELCYCLEYLCYINKFSSFSLEKRGRYRDVVYNPHDGQQADLLIRGSKSDIWLKLGYYSTGWELGPHLEAIERSVAHLSTLNGKDTKLFLELVVSRGKYAKRTIEDCISKIQETCGIQFDRYSPYLVLTLYNEYRDPLEESIILRLFFSYVT
jgi:hypothetical protein